MSSPVDLKCPGCATVLRVPPSVFGKKIKCKHCGHAFVVPDPAAKAKAAARPAAPASPPPPPPARSPFLDDDEGPTKIEVIHEDDSARCPHCAQLLEPATAAVCVHCGFNNVTRKKAETKKVWAPTLEDWVMHLWPGVTALSIVIGWIVFDIISLMRMREWLEGSFLEMDELDAAGQKRYFVAPGFFIAVIWMASLVISVPAAKFAYRRLVKEYRPPEKVKT